MTTLEEALGFDPESLEVQRATLLAQNDRALLRALIAIREAKGISQALVGEAMGISQPSVAAFEKHDSNPKLSTIRRYAHAIGALVKHEVAADEGQLSDRRSRDAWRTVYLVDSAKAHISGSTEAKFMATVHFEPDLGAATFRASNSSKIDTPTPARTSFALAA